MAKQRQRRRKRDDPIGDLQAWQNHQYEPGYLGNLGRLRLFSTGRSSISGLLLSRLGAIIALLLVGIMLVSANISMAIATVLVGLLMMMVVIVTLVQVLQMQARRSRHHRRR
ncbi:MAG: hypothetical protein HGA45_18780 [Chloroflexales bacterium]|nr:hypothetical protein [Chloroflexales bacterium]